MLDHEDPAVWLTSVGAALSNVPCVALGKLETRRWMLELRRQREYANTPPATEWGAKLHIIKAARGLRTVQEGAEDGQYLDALDPTIDALMMHRAGDPDALPMLRLALDTVQSFETDCFELSDEEQHLLQAVAFLGRPRGV